MAPMRAIAASLCVILDRAAGTPRPYGIWMISTDLLSVCCRVRPLASLTGPVPGEHSRAGANQP